MLSNTDYLYSILEENLSEQIQRTDCVVGLALKDLVSGREFAIKGDTVLPIGSAIKIGVLLEFFRQAKLGKLSVQDRVWIEKNHKIGGSGVLQFLGDHSVNCSWRDIAALMILVSDNAATNMLIDLVGMENVNKTFQNLGLKATRLARKMIDEDAARKGRENVSTPCEMRSLLTLLHTSSNIDKDVSQQTLEVLRMYKEGPLRSGVPPETMVANKTGTLPGVMVDCGIIYLPDRPYALCVMTTFLRDPLTGEELIRRISRIVYDYLWRISKSTPFGRRFVP